VSDVIEPPSLPGSAPSSGFGGLSPFDYDPRTRVVFGPGTLGRLGALAAELGGQRVLLVTDKGLRQAGHEAQAIERLKESGLDVAVFDDVHPNPTTDDVDQALAAARDHRADLLVGLGGGSSMDCAKGANFLYTNGGRMQDYWGVGRASKPMLPMIAVPTTAGTGSEAQSFAVIADAATHMKMACGDKKAACRVALLDPELTRTMPPAVTAATGIDALSHALESFVTTRRNPVSMLFSRQAWQLLIRSFPVVLQRPQQADARGAMLLGAHLAGAAIENSMLGAAHACANPLSAHYDVTHGIAVGLMLPHVIRFNAAHVAGAYGTLAEDAGLCAADDPAAAERLAERVTSLLALAEIPTSLSALGIPSEALEKLSAEAAAQWTGRFNPRPLTIDDFAALYRAALV
jgi:alcohol dehydrogenase